MPALLTAERRLCALAGDTNNARFTATPASFWEKALASLPPAIRHRYAADFEAAERYERLLEQVIEFWDATLRALGWFCDGAARVLLKSAWKLKDKGRRLSLTH